MYLTSLFLLLFLYNDISSIYINVFDIEKYYYLFTYLNNRICQNLMNLLLILNKFQFK